MSASTILRVLGLAWRYAWAAPWTAAGLLAALPAWAFGAHLARRDGTIEAHGGRLGDFASRGCFGAITLGHVILACDGPTLEALRRHERVHVRQYEAWGLLFVPAYLLASAWVWCRGGRAHADNPFERAACR
jgi:hypothetical protein